MFHNIRKGAFNNTSRYVKIQMSGLKMSSAYPNGTLAQGFLNIPGTANEMGEAILYLPFVEYGAIGFIFLQSQFPACILWTTKERGERVLRGSPEYSLITPPPNRPGIGHLKANCEKPKRMPIF